VLFVLTLFRGSGELCRGLESISILDYYRLSSVFGGKSSLGLVSRSRSRSIVVDTPVRRAQLGEALCGTALTIYTIPHSMINVH
jgi:hypothetical protein